MVIRVLNYPQFGKYIIYFNILSESILFGIFFYLLIKAQILKIGIRICIPIFVIISFFIFLSEKGGFANYPSLIESFLFLILITFYFFEVMNSEVVYPVYQTVEFWLVVGCLLFFAGNFFMFVFYNSTKTPSEANLARLIYSFVTILKNTVFSLSFFGSTGSLNEDNIIKVPENLSLDSFQKSASDN